MVFDIQQLLAFAAYIEKNKAVPQTFLSCLQHDGPARRMIWPEAPRQCCPGFSDEPNRLINRLIVPSGVAGRAGYAAVQHHHASAIEGEGLDVGSVRWRLGMAERVMAKACLWQAHRDDGLFDEQVKVLGRLLHGGERSFDGVSAQASCPAVGAARGTC
ncbi:hypothetical protein [Stenotrophomonas tumulicola]|uniref:Uncharacterized protein n=1 Tax=Stenotrophomonas tumulicola TaxID=1685415 RepID=A0A7W3FMI9_9GAMM|nr:hypothetical protein [Stenotrophomonas tumulicola]MBA8681942.1 hypothetical protein [Stenotrophomonas tumulicola]